MKEVMKERRSSPRLLCSDLVGLEVQDGKHPCREVANLENIGATGACLATENYYPVGTKVKIVHEDVTLHGFVRYCIPFAYGYLTGICFDQGERWSAQMFEPAHLVDPAKLLQRQESGPRFYKKIKH